LDEEAWADGLQSVLEAEGLKRMDAPFSQPGDILLGLAADGQIAAHLCLGTRVLSATTEAGVIQIRREDIHPSPLFVMAWRGD
jgi:hypothetical protein